MLLDCLFKSIRVVTYQAKKAHQKALERNRNEKFDWFPNLIAIWRFLNCLDSLLSKIEEKASSYTKVLEDILGLESLKELT